MQPALTVKHATGSYPIHIGSGLLDRGDALLRDLLASGQRPALVTDTNCLPYCQRLAESLKKILSGSTAPGCIRIEPGEASKSPDVFQSVCSELLKARMDRDTTLIAVGGGVVGDLAGFVAATFLRGIRFVQVPTTLLAQVDSSVGGKTGINLPRAKNSVGAFWQPQAVLIDPEVLKTLDAAEYTSGLAEVVKYGVIMDPEFFEFLEAHTAAINGLDLPTLETLILRCCELKAQVVEQDERETGGRRVILNYGHTFGHAIESVFGYGEIPHGHAVAMGMHAAAHLATLLQQADESLVGRQGRLLESLNIPYGFPRSRHEELLAAMQYDKKAVAGMPRFILPTRLGNVEMVSSVDRAQVLESMQRACQVIS